MTAPVVSSRRLLRAARVAMAGALVASGIACSPTSEASPAPSGVSNLSFPTPEAPSGASLAPSTPPSIPPPSPSAVASPTPGPVAGSPGLTWKCYEPTSIDGEPLRSLAQPMAANGRFLAIAEGEVIGKQRLAYSDDGRTWHFARVPASICCEFWSVRFGNGHWLAMPFIDPDRYAGLQSGDGRTWDFVAGGPLILGDGSEDSEAEAFPIDMVWHKGSWFVLSQHPTMTGDTLFRSADGANWSVVSTFPGDGRSSQQSIESDGTTLVVTQIGADASLVAWWSADGVAWERASFSGSVAARSAWIEAGHGRWIELSDSGAAWWSSDGRTWQAGRIDGDPGGGYLRMPLVVADGFLAFDIDRGRPWASGDGRVWAPLAGFKLGSGLVIEGAAQTGGTTLLMGSDAGHPVVWIATPS